MSKLSGQSPAGRRDLGIQLLLSNCVWFSLSFTPKAWRTTRTHRRKGDRTQLIEEDNDDGDGGGLAMVAAAAGGGGYGAVAFHQSEAAAAASPGGVTDINLNLGESLHGFMFYSLNDWILF